jgi:carboxyl-terminal processing protease
LTTKHRWLKIISWILLLQLHTTIFANNTSCPAYNDFDNITATITNNFYDSNFHGLPWNILTKEYRNLISCNSDEFTIARITNQLLKNLKTSHSEIYTQHDLLYWTLNNVFTGQIDTFKVYQFGIWTKETPHGLFISNVFEGSVAYKNGIKTGDKIILIDKQSPVTTLFTHNNTHTLLLERQPQNYLSIQIQPEFISMQRTFLRATTQSVKVFNVNKYKIGYIHLWAGTNDAFKKVFQTNLQSLGSKVDALIIDLRDGVGGANPEFLEPLYKNPKLNKLPLVVIINNGVRSGKEWLASKLKNDHKAILIGETTSGAFIAGKPFPINNNKYLLFLAVKKLNYGEQTNNIEGHGVTPSIHVPFNLEYSNGKDPQLDAAINYLSQK